MPERALPGVQPPRPGPSPREYLVIGPYDVHGVPTNGVVVLDADHGATQALIEAGHIRPVEKSTASKGEAGSKGE